MKSPKKNAKQKKPRAGKPHIVKAESPANNKKSKPLAKAEIEVGPVGKPPWVPTEETAAEVERMAKLGYRNQDIFFALGISCETFYKKLHEYPELKHALKRGRDAHLTGDLTHLDRLKTNDSLGAVIFSMKGTHGFSDQPSLGTEGAEAIGESFADGILRALERRAKGKSDARERAADSTVPL
jgi:hypothetical protein